MRIKGYVIKPWSNLENANLRSANLESAKLGSANLVNANLGFANLRFANLGNANLENANLRSANLENANLENADLRYTNLRYANLGSVNLENANLENADLESANLENTNLVNANLKNTKLPSPTMILLANWGELSKKTTKMLMRLDCSSIPDGKRLFARWKKIGVCPYEDVNVQRVASFNEHRKWWTYGPPPTIWEAMCAVLDEKCPGWRK